MKGPTLLKHQARKSAPAVTKLGHLSLKRLQYQYPVSSARYYANHRLHPQAAPSVGCSIQGIVCGITPPAHRKKPHQTATAAVIPIPMKIMSFHRKKINKGQTLWNMDRGYPERPYQPTCNPRMERFMKLRRQRNSCLGTDPRIKVEVPTHVIPPRLMAYAGRSSS